MAPRTRKFCLEVQAVLCDRAEDFTHRARYLMRIVVKVSACKIHRVAAEQLVRTFTGKHDLHIAAGILARK